MTIFLPHVAKIELQENVTYEEREDEFDLNGTEDLQTEVLAHDCPQKDPEITSLPTVDIFGLSSRNMHMKTREGMHNDIQASTYGFFLNVTPDADVHSTDDDR